MSFIINPFAMGAGGGGGGSLPTDLSDLELWLPVSALSQADDSDITSWPDQSGNARNATGTGVGGAKPKYRTSGGPTSGPCVEMSNGANSRNFSLASFLTGYTAGEAFVVANINADPPPSTSNSGPPLGDWGSAANSALWPYFGDSAIYENFGTTVRKDATSNPTTALTNWVVYNVRSASGAFSWRINAATAGNDQFSTGTNTVGWGTAPMIGFSAPASAYMFGHIVDIIFFSRILDDATERKPIIHDYINTNASYGGFFALPTS